MIQNQVKYTQSDVFFLLVKKVYSFFMRITYFQQSLLLVFNSFPTFRLKSMVANQCFFEAYTVNCKVFYLLRKSTAR